MNFYVIAMQPCTRETHVAKTCFLRTGLALLRRFSGTLLLGVLGTSFPTLAFAQAKETVREPVQYSARDLEVRLDGLPDDIPAAQIEIVLEVSDSQCKPAPTKFLGITMPTVVHAAMARFCSHVDTYLGTHKGPIPLQLSRKDWTHRKLADQVQDLDVSLGRRYVLLSRWRYYNAQVDAYAKVRRVRWIAEEALWDRETRKVLWHSLRNIYCNDHYEGGRIWGTQIELRRHFAFRLPALLMQRGAVRQHAPVPEGRWVPSAEVEAWRSESRAAIAFINNHLGDRYREYPRGFWFLIGAESQQPYVSEPYVWGDDDSMRRENIPKAGITPPIDIGTYALLELPPGRYIADPDNAKRDKPIVLELRPGEITVIEYSRAVIGPDLPEVVDIEKLRKTMPRGPHAFLQDTRVLPAQWQVETWFTGH